ncbi:MAG TPA: small ribosomal subunit biogenesis GTPase RsgA [Chromatiaceae bacterium]|jgi:ribosome biogenesis GTPase|nr:small ribosomal subunit biogenesis GTPase RsgA [Chromatiaceae bacterium]HIA08451.1 small ribosomal subunit biogenesis GTPase RsgA [Chromatiaceae bacterium]HIB84816.1 small ribosomal subunit biogenesis GTPase RsgA [Chromatiaceae bacterium]HIO13962.1 small ribosomal subunit biogenesis GTPase RsgA [Chromatiales bacterium]HIO53678.1 small ribosomal subunit biogenesis GTPase RsgA [Chromatiales bacterium]
MGKRHLSQQQKQRIRSIQAKRLERANERVRRLEEELDERSLGPDSTGQVIVHHGSHLIIEDHAGDEVRCFSRQNLGSVVCGDHVVWQETEPGHGVVTAVQDRSSILSRPVFDGQNKPLAANIDRIVIIAAVVPELSEFLIDSYLVAAELTGIQPVIALNKVDLLNADELDALLERLQPYEDLGYNLFTTSHIQQEGLEQLRRILTDHVSILVGQSGVGKSSLIRALIPHLEIRVGEISEATGFGRHTTSSTMLYHLESGGDLIDSPGVRQFRLSEMPEDRLLHGFVEFREWVGHCQFANCQHRQEPGCALRQAVADGQIDQRRLDSYHRLVEANATIAKRPN